MTASGRWARLRAWASRPRPADVAPWDAGALEWLHGQVGRVRDHHAAQRLRRRTRGAGS